MGNPMGTGSCVSRIRCAIIVALMTNPIAIPSRLELITTVKASEIKRRVM